MREPRLRAAPPVTVPQGSPLPSGWNRAPASGSRHDHPPQHCHCNIHSLLPLGAHTTPGLCLGFPLIMFALLLFPHYLASGAMPPPPRNAPPTPIGSDFWGNSQQINICTALVVPYCCIDTLTSLAPAAPDHGLPEVREGVRAITQNPSSRRKQPHATTG